VAKRMRTFLEQRIFHPDMGFQVSGQSNGFVLTPILLAGHAYVHNIYTYR